MISFTVFEYVVSVVLESLFGLRWWDYTGEPFNFQGRISLAFSLAWGSYWSYICRKNTSIYKIKIRKVYNFNFKKNASYNFKSFISNNYC